MWSAASAIFARMRDRLKQKIWIVVAEAMVWLSILEAKRFLRKIGPLTVLVDNSALGHGTTHRSVWINTGTKYWGGQIPLETGYRARVPLYASDDPSGTYREVTYLVGIAELARVGLIKFVTSAELHAERFRHPIGRFSGYGWDDLNVFEGIPMPSIDGYELDLKDAKQVQLDRLAASHVEPFKSVETLLPPKSNLDAWHIHTAHTHNLYCFLSMDLNLVDRVRNLREQFERLQIHSRVLRPSELAEVIRLRPIPIFWLSYRNARWFVHPELHIKPPASAPKSRGQRGASHRP